MEKSRSNARTKISNVLVETRNEHRGCADELPPGRRMELAFLLSMNALKLLRAGLRAQGFSEAEIREQLRSKRR